MRINFNYIFDVSVKKFFTHFRYKFQFVYTYTQPNLHYQKNLHCFISITSDFYSTACWKNGSCLYSQVNFVFSSTIFVQMDPSTLNFCIIEPRNIEFRACELLCEESHSRILSRKITMGRIWVVLVHLFRYLNN